MMWPSGIIEFAFVILNDLHGWPLADHLQNHSASYGFAPHRRHAVRVGCHGERPTFDPKGTSQEDEYVSRYRLPQVSKDGSGVSNYND